MVLTYDCSWPSEKLRFSPCKIERVWASCKADIWASKYLLLKEKFRKSGKIKAKTYFFSENSDTTLFERVDNGAAGEAPSLLWHPTQVQIPLQWAPPWKHSQYFFKHIDFLHRQPFLWAIGADSSCSIGLAVLYFDSKAFGFRSNTFLMAITRLTLVTVRFSHSTHLQYCPQMALPAKHWQYLKRDSKKIISNKKKYLQFQTFWLSAIACFTRWESMWFIVVILNILVVHLRNQFRNDKLIQIEMAYCLLARWNRFFLVIWN